MGRTRRDATTSATPSCFPVRGVYEAGIGRLPVRPGPFFPGVERTQTPQRQCTGPICVLRQLRCWPRFAPCWQPAAKTPGLRKSARARRPRDWSRYAGAAQVANSAAKTNFIATATAPPARELARVQTGVAASRSHSFIGCGVPRCQGQF